MKKFIGNKDFYKLVAALALPLLLQNADGTETEELRRIYFKDKG